MTSLAQYDIRAQPCESGIRRYAFISVLPTVHDLELVNHSELQFPHLQDVCEHGEKAEPFSSSNGLQFHNAVRRVPLG